MASPSGSDHSTHSSIYWGSASDSEAPAPGEFPDYRPTSSPFNSIAAPPRPRLSSPRVFQDFFSTTAAGTSAVQTSTRVPSAPSQPSVHDFPRAFENVNRAVQTAHEAFRNTPIIDLTTPPPRERTIQDTGMARKRMQRASPTSLSPDSTLSAPTYSTAISPGSSRRSRLLLPQNSRTSQSRSSAVPAPESTSADGRAPKRLRILYANDGSNRPNEPSQYTPDTPQEVEAVDLTEVDDASDLSRALSKQRQDTIQAQMKRDRGRESSGRTPLSSYKCPICMDTPEDATVTSCGTYRDYQRTGVQLADITPPKVTCFVTNASLIL